MALLDPVMPLACYFYPKGLLLIIYSSSCFSYSILSILSLLFFDIGVSGFKSGFLLLTCGWLSYPI
jgi:hypothetical protein